MKKCVVWGTRAAGQHLAEQAACTGEYKIVAYCSSNKSSQGGQIGGCPVISPQELNSQYRAGKIDSILLGMKNPVYIKEVEEIIAQIFPAEVSVIYPDLIENDYLKRLRNELKFCWNIDFEKQAGNWIENLPTEVDFWANHVASPAGDSHRDYVIRMENQDLLGVDSSPVSFAQSLKAGSIVLDIGCGLVSQYGPRLPTSEMIQLISVDPLAPFYNRINQKYAAGKFRTCEFGLFEFIANFYDEGYCDGILINNALDHCIDPYKSIVECLYVLKKSGKMRLYHRRAEAVYEAYHGLHKWNLDYNENNEFIIWNRENAVNVSERLKGIADIKIVHSDDNSDRYHQYVAADITKKSNFQLDSFFELKKERNQLAFLVGGLMNWIAEHDDMLAAL